MNSVFQKNESSGRDEARCSKLRGILAKANKPEIPGYGFW